VWTGWVPPTYVALCGARVDTASPSETGYPYECEFSGTTAHCAACLRETARQNE